jgi:hypothetical protein
MSLASLLRRATGNSHRNSTQSPQPCTHIEGLESRSLLSVAPLGQCPQAPGSDALVVSLKRTATLNLKGTFKGTAKIPGLGTLPLTLVVTSQPKGKIVGTLASAGTSPVDFKAKVTYGANRTFTADINNASGVAHITGKLSTDGKKLTGSLTGMTSTGTDGSATFSLKKQ